MTIPLIKSEDGHKRLRAKNCDKITKETKELMFQLIKKSTKNEYLIKLCEDKNGNIVPSKFCKGTKCHVKTAEMVKLSCPTGTIEIGNFHTHPSSRYPSDNDIILVASTTIHTNPFLCIGASWSDTKKEKTDIIDMIRCYEVTDKELLRLGKESQELVWQGKIDKAKKEILPMMFDRIEKVNPGREDDKLPGTLNLICKMSRKR